MMTWLCCETFGGESTGKSQQRELKVVAYDFVEVFFSGESTGKSQQRELKVNTLPISEISVVVESTGKSQQRELKEVIGTLPRFTTYTESTGKSQQRELKGWCINGNRRVWSQSQRENPNKGNWKRSICQIVVTGF